MRRLTQILPMAALLIALFFTSSCQKKSEPQTTAAAVVDSVFSADSVVIYYQVQGSGSPVLVFIHGWACDRSYWDNQVEFFADKVKVVTIDLAGHGQSGLNRQNWTMASFGEDVAAIVKKLDLNQVILVGHSMGGPVIVEAAKRLPERVVGLIGVETFHDIGKRISAQETEESAASLRRDFEGTMKGWVRKMFAATADSALVEEIATKAASADPDAVIGILEKYHELNLAEAIKDVHLPIMTINTDMYPMNEESNRKLVESLEVIMMPGYGHYPMIEAPEIFNAHLTKAMQKIIKGTAPGERRRTQ